MKIEEIANIERLRSVQGWCCGIGIAFMFIALGMFPYASRNPGTMAMSAFAPFREVGSMAWMVIPIAIVGVLFLTYAVIVSWKIKKLLRNRH